MNIIWKIFFSSDKIKYAHNLKTVKSTLPLAIQQPAKLDRPKTKVSASSIVPTVLQENVNKKGLNNGV